MLRRVGAESEREKLIMVTSAIDSVSFAGPRISNQMRLAIEAVAEKLLTTAKRVETSYAIGTTIAFTNDLYNYTRIDIFGDTVQLRWAEFTTDDNGNWVDDDILTAEIIETKFGNNKYGYRINLTGKLVFDEGYEFRRNKSGYFETCYYHENNFDDLERTELLDLFITTLIETTDQISALDIYKMSSVHYSDFHKVKDE